MGLLPWVLPLPPRFQQMVTNGPIGLRIFCPFLGQTRWPPSTPRVKPQSRGMAGLGHALPWKSSAGTGMAACGVMVWSLYNCREADCLARAEPLRPRCSTTGSLEWGPAGWARSSIRPHHSPPWLRSRQTLRYAGWRWGFVPAVSTVEPIFLRKQLSGIAVVPEPGNPENPEFNHVP